MITEYFDIEKERISLTDDKAKALFNSLFATEMFRKLFQQHLNGATIKAGQFIELLYPAFINEENGKLVPDQTFWVEILEDFVVANGVVIKTRIQEDYALAFMERISNAEPGLHDFEDVYLDIDLGKVYIKTIDAIHYWSVLTKKEVLDEQ